MGKQGHGLLVLPWVGTFVQKIGQQVDERTEQRLLQTNPTIQPSEAIPGPKESSARPGPVALTPSLTADFKFGSLCNREDTSSFLFVLSQPRGTNSQFLASISALCLTIPRPVQPPNGGGR